MAVSARDSKENRRRHIVTNGGTNKRLCTVDGLRLKSERDEDIKNYVETTMNELLGWYGYDKVNSGEAARDLSIHHRTRRPSSSSTSLQETSSPSRGEEASEEMSERELSGPDTGGTVTPLLDVETVTQQSGKATCAWCLKDGLKLFSQKTAGGQTKVFCSELCFDQCRRAAFKKNRICDWCKHVRHTVNYVDFQDKDHQLQFCSDKCLNQYKMNIFCKETQAYLQMNPQLRDSKAAGSSSSIGASLITPDLWMKDCKEFTNGHLNFSDDDDDSMSLDRPSNIETPTSTSQFPCTSDKLLYTENSEHLSNDPFEKRDKITKLDYNKQNEMHDIFKYNTEKQTLDRRKKHRVTDRNSRSERKSSSKSKGSTNDNPDLFLPTSMNLSSKKFDVTDPPPYSLSSPPFHPPSFLNGPGPIRNTRSPSPCTGPPLPTASIPTTLPPPPPLLNSELLHHTFPNPQLYQPPMNLFSQQQQMDALLAMQSGLGMRMGFPNHSRTPYPEFMTPSALNMNNSQPAFSSSTVSPSTMMLPYPVVIPLPFPIPIPIPISSTHIQNAKQIINKSKVNHSFQKSSTSATEQGKRVDSIITKLKTKHEENSSNRENKDTEKQKDGKNRNLQKAEKLVSSESVSSTSSHFSNYMFYHENQQCHNTDLQRDKHKRPSDYSSDKMKHFKLAETFHS